MIDNKVPLFDFNPVKEAVVDISELIEEVRNLQSNILNELRKPTINKEYIDECTLEIEKVILDILDISGSNTQKFRKTTHIVDPNNPNICYTKGSIKVLKH